jgi:hypothetical protein
MVKSARALATLGVVAIAVGGALGCGGSGASGAGKSGGALSGAVVARVGDTPITQAAVGHWMGTLAGGDYYELSGHARLPDGLVSEPPNYQACVAHLQAAAAGVPRQAPAPTGEKLLRKCRELYAALRTQATAFLVKTAWTVAAYRALGVIVSDQEVLRRYVRWRAEHRLTSQGALDGYMASLRRTPADEQVILKLDLLSNKAQQTLAGGGRRQAAKLTEAEQAWTSATSCRPGYVVLHCKQYTGAPAYPTAQSSPAVLMEQVAALATGRCINREACAKQ